MDPATRRRSELLDVLRRVGVDADAAQRLEADLPDPVDLDRDGAILLRHGLTRERLENSFGSSP